MKTNTELEKDAPLPTPTSETAPSISTCVNLNNDFRISEEDPLLPQPDETFVVNAISIKREVVGLIKIAIPCVASSVLSYVSKIVISLLVGHIGPKELAAATLAVMFTNVFGFSLSIGLLTALDTLSSQAVTGSTDKRYCGIILQRALLINFVVMIPMLMIWLNSTPLLIAMGQDPELAELSGVFIRYLLPTLPSGIINNAVSKFLQAQQLMDAPFYIVLFILPINILLQYLLTMHPSTAVGFHGAAIGASIADWIIAIGLIGYATFVNGYQCWHPWTWRAFNKWGQFLKLGLPGIIMVCLEWWSFEAVALVAGLFGETVLAAQAVVLNTGSLFYTIFLGMSIANSNRVGNLLGAGKPQHARFAAYTSLVITAGFALINSGILLSSRFVWGFIFTSSQDVTNVVSTVLPILALFQIFDASACVCGGILRGSGRQHIGAICNLIAYYIIGLPLGAVLTFIYNLQLVGIWSGLALALSMTFFFQFLYISFRIDWNEEVRKARQRVNIGGLSL